MNKYFYPVFFGLFGQLEVDVSKIREGNQRNSTVCQGKGGLKICGFGLKLC